MSDLPNNNELNDALVSVIIPVYNSRKYLGICLDSVVAQSYPSLEIILVNDGSTDGSKEICEVYAQKDKRIKTIHANNQGPAAARNAGIASATGDYILFVDSDDYLEAGAVKLLIERNKENDADIIIGDFNKIGAIVSGSEHQAYFNGTTLLNIKDIIDYVRRYLKRPNKFPLFVYSWGRLFRASIIKAHRLAFDTELFTFEDVAFNFNYLKFTNKILFVREVVYDHLVHDNYSSAGMTVSNDPIKLFGYRQAMVSVHDFLAGSDFGPELTREIGHAYISYTIIQLIRTCGQIDHNNKDMIRELVRTIVSTDNVKGNLQYYSPAKGDSRLLPILMKFKLVWPIIWACKYKAHKRYTRKVG